jgi:hypothetical protein
MEGTHLSFSVRLSFLFQKKIAIFSSKNNIWWLLSLCV